MLNLTMIMQCIYIYVKIIFVHPVSGVSIYRSKCNENSYKTKKKPQVAHVNTLKIYLLDLDCHVICDIFTSTFNILLEAAFKRKKKGPMMKFTGTSAPSFCSSFTMKCFWCHSISQWHWWKLSTWTVLTIQCALF